MPTRIPETFLITPDEKLGVIDFGCIKTLPDDFYYPFFSLVSANVLDDKQKTIEAFRKLEMILPTDTAFAGRILLQMVQRNGWHVCKALCERKLRF